VLRRLPTISPRAYTRVALSALVLNAVIVLTGAAVRLTGSGLGCTNWPKCTDDSYIAPLDLHSWIEFGNRLITGVVGLPCLLAFFLAFRRRPFRRDLLLLSVLLPLGVLAQAILGGITVLTDLRAEIVMGHFLLSMALLGAAVALWWRARSERSERADAQPRKVVLATRALVPLGLLAITAGTFASAAGPHSGGDGTNDVVPRLTVFGTNTLDTLIHWHGRTGTLLGLATLGAWYLARKHGASPVLKRALTTIALLVASQGVVGFIQYELQLPAGIVWVHIVIATLTWVAILVAVAAAGALAPAEARRPAAAAVRA
jgi:cytochrome c oxidase assembly protein subunit 15